MQQSCYIHSNSLLQQKDKDKNQQREETHRAASWTPGMSFQVFFPGGVLQARLTYPRNVVNVHRVLPNRKAQTYPGSQGFTGARHIGMTDHPPG